MSLSIVAFCISVLSLCIAIKSYRRKSGIFVRGMFSIASSSACNDHYITSVALENLKDRAVTIFAIYLKVGHNYYIEIENLEETPLILKPFETFRNEYGPIEFYGINFNRINLNDLLNVRKVNKRLILSTSDGKYIVSSSIRRWSPVGDFFRNHMTAIIRPVPSKYKGIYMGENVKYIIEFTYSNNKEEIVPVLPGDYKIKKFRNFQLNKESLKSKDTLIECLQLLMDNGKLSCSKFTVHDVNEWREKSTNIPIQKIITAKYYNFFNYYIIARASTVYSDWKRSRANIKRNKHKNKSS